MIYYTNIPMHTAFPPPTAAIREKAIYIYNVQQYYAFILTSSVRIYFYTWCNNVHHPKILKTRPEQFGQDLQVSRHPM